MESQPLHVAKSMLNGTITVSLMMKHQSSIVCAGFMILGSLAGFRLSLHLQCSCEVHIVTQSRRSTKDVN